MATRVGAVLHLCLGERAPCREHHAEGREIVRRHPHRRDLLGRAALADHRGTGAIRGHTRERGDLSTPVVVVGQRGAIVGDAGLWIRVVDAHQPIRVWKRQRPQEQRVNDREDREVRADADRQRRESGGGEAGRPPEQPNRVARIATYSVEHPQPACVTAVVLDAFEPAEFHACAAHGFLHRHSGAHQIVGVLLEVEAQLLGHAVLEPAPAHERAHQRSQPLHHLKPRRATFEALPSSRRRVGSSQPFPRADAGALPR